MATDSVRERTQRANSEAKIMLSVILGFSALVVAFMVFMMANAPDETIICPESVESGSWNVQQPEGVLNAAIPLHPSLPGGSADRDCTEPTYFGVS